MNTLHTNMQAAIEQAVKLGHKLDPGFWTPANGDGTRYRRRMGYCKNRCGFTVVVSSNPHSKNPVSGPAVEVQCVPNRLDQPGETYIHHIAKVPA